MFYLGDNKSMLNFAFFLKTYREDYERALRLIDSYQKYNVDAIPLFLMCPEIDMEVFLPCVTQGVTIIKEEDIKTEIFTEDGQWTAGYLNQEIYKLAFWELGLCNNYICLDSDGIFIRPFYKKDFMYDENTPYTTLVEDNDLRADCYYNQMYWNGRRERIRKIEDTMDFHPYKLMTCHGFQIFSGKVLKSLKEDFMKAKGYSYKNLIEIAPYEFTWYNLWLQKSVCIPIHICEPVFKTFHLKQHHIFNVLKGMNIEDWSRGYVGIIVNSNYGVGNGEYDDLLVYNTQNADIPDSIVIKNYLFYRRLKRGIFKRKIKGALMYARRLFD